MLLYDVALLESTTTLANRILEFSHRHRNCPFFILTFGFLEFLVSQQQTNEKKAMPSGRHKSPKKDELKHSSNFEEEKKVLTPKLKLNLTSQGLVRKNNKVSPAPGLSRPRAISDRDSSKLEEIPSVGIAPPPKSTTEIRRKKSERDFMHELKYLSSEEEEPFLVFDPNNPYRASWDICIMLCLLYIFLFTPLDLAFEEPSSLGWVVFAALVDLIFWADIFVCFRTAYFSPDGELITDTKLIAKHYINDFFFIDLVSCLPGFPLSILIEKFLLEGGGNASIVKIGKAPRVLKVVRSIECTFDPIFESYA